MSRRDDPAGEAWGRWVKTMTSLAERLQRSDFPTDDRGRAEGVRHLARQAALALQGELEHSDARHPRLHRYELPWSQWGAPNPDNVYERCAIDPSATYVLRGHVAGVHEALFSLVEGDMHLDENGVFAEVALSDLAVDVDGYLELVIGPDAPDGNHLRSTPDARLLLIRQYLYDWEYDPVVSFTIERVDLAGVPALPPTPEDVAAALDRAARWVERSIDYWAAYVAASRDLLDHNTFTPPNTPPGGAPSIAYGGGCWDLGRGEVLLIEHDEPDAHYWNWSIHNLYWFDSGAWDERLMSCNGRQAHVDGDGKVRLVVAHAGPRSTQLARHRRSSAGHGRVPLRRGPVEAAADRACRGAGRPARRASRRPSRRRRGRPPPSTRRPLPRRAAALELAEARRACPGSVRMRRRGSTG